MERTSYVFLANGFEEIEALTVVDVMRRAGMPVKTVSINSGDEVVGAHGVVVKADMLVSQGDYSAAEWLVAPGGMPGASNLAACGVLCDALKAHNAKKGRIAAICAAPAVVLAPLGILDGKKATCYPSFEDHINESCLVAEPVVVSDNVVTGNGPAAAMNFALAIVGLSHGEEQAFEIASGMLLRPTQQHIYF